MTLPQSLMSDGAVAETLRLAAETPAGCFAEIGVYQGGFACRLAELARRQGRKLHLFDTFSGIPVKGLNDGHNVGDFADAALADVVRLIPEAMFHVGIFPETMPAEMPTLAFVHCDCDQEESVGAVIDTLFPRLAPGGVMAFDDMNQRGARALIRRRFKSELKQAPHDRWYVRKTA